jgi:hypothetical protein
LDAFLRLRRRRLRRGNPCGNLAEKAHFSGFSQDAQVYDVAPSSINAVETPTGAISGILIDSEQPDLCGWNRRVRGAGIAVGTAAMEVKLFYAHKQFIQ